MGRVDRRRVKRYSIIHSQELDELEDFVNLAIQQGWQPFGSIQVVLAKPNESKYFQTMVKHYSLADTGPR